jgi:hypothetical protein
VKYVRIWPKGQGKYVRVWLKGQRRSFLLRVTRETDRMISGYEIDHEGEEISGETWDRRLRLIDKSLIERLQPMRMNLTYACLEEDK